MRTKPGSPARVLSAFNQWATSLVRIYFKNSQWFFKSRIWSNRFHRGIFIQMCHCTLSKFIFLLCCTPPGSCLPPTGSCPSSRQSLLYSLVSCVPVLSFLPLITAFLSLSWPLSSFKYFTHIYNYKHTHIHLRVHICVCIYNIYYICVWGWVYMCLYMYICVLLCDLKSTFYTWEKMWCLVFWVWHILPHLPISSSIHFPTNVTTVLWLWIPLSTQWLISGSSSVHSI